MVHCIHGYWFMPFFFFFFFFFVFFLNQKTTITDFPKVVSPSMNERWKNTVMQALKCKIMHHKAVHKLEHDILPRDLLTTKTPTPPQTETLPSPKYKHTLTHTTPQKRQGQGQRQDRTRHIHKHNKNDETWGKPCTAWTASHLPSISLSNTDLVHVQAPTTLTQSTYAIAYTKDKI